MFGRSLPRNWSAPMLPCSGGRPCKGFKKTWLFRSRQPLSLTRGGIRWLEHNGPQPNPPNHGQTNCFPCATVLSPNINLRYWKPCHHQISFLSSIFRRHHLMSGICLNLCFTPLLSRGDCFWRATIHAITRDLLPGSQKKTMQADQTMKQSSWTLCQRLKIKVTSAFPCMMWGKPLSLCAKCWKVYLPCKGGHFLYATFYFGHCKDFTWIRQETLEYLW